jgi:hypothetical protein
MRRFAWIFVLVLAPIVALGDQPTPNLPISASATITTSGGAATIGSLLGQNQCTIDVAGTYTGTLNVQASTTWSNVQVTPYNTSVAQTGISAPGLYYVNVAGVSQLRVNGPTSSGSALVYVNCVYLPGGIAARDVVAPLGVVGRHLTIPTPFPIAGNCIGVAGYTVSYTCSTPGPTQFDHIVAGSNIVSSPNTGPTPSVAVTQAPSFTSLTIANPLLDSSGGLTPTTWPTTMPANQTLIGFGNSIMEQGNTTNCSGSTHALTTPPNAAGTCYFDRVAVALGFHSSIDLGLGGSTLQHCTPNPDCTIASGIDRYVSTIIPYAGPNSWLIIDYSANDVNVTGAGGDFANFSPSNYTANLVTIITAMIAAGTPASHIIICGGSFEDPVYYSTSNGYTFAYNAASAQAALAVPGVRFADTYSALAINGGVANLYGAAGTTRIHPTDAGSVFLASAVKAATIAQASAVAPVANFMASAAMNPTVFNAVSQQTTLSLTANKIFSLNGAAYATVPTISSGWLGSSQTATCGGLALGGTTSIGYLDFGCNHAGAWQFGGSGGDIYLNDIYGNLAAGLGVVLPASILTVRGAATPTVGSGTAVSWNLSASAGEADLYSDYNTTNATSKAVSFGAFYNGSLTEAMYCYREGLCVSPMGWQSGSSTYGTTSAIVNGPISAVSSGATGSYVAPVYTNSGTAIAATVHSVIGTCAFSASVSCTPAAFSGAAVFASATSYSCSASGGAGTFAQTGALSVGSQSTTGIIITAAVSNSQTVAYRCTGT